MSERIGWLWEQSKGWVEKGLITDEQATRIRSLYPAPKAALPWGMLIFSGIGAAIVGLGIILLLAYNWHAIPKGGKLGLIFAALGGLHGAGIALWLRGERWRQLGEVCCLLGTMVFGAGIWLIAQIYHIAEHYPNGFLIWGLGALALAWAMSSLPQALLAALTLCIWNCCEGWGFDTASHWGPLLLLGGLGALAWRLRSRLLLVFVLATFIFALCANVSAVESELVLRVLLCVGALFVAAGILSKQLRWFPEGAAVWSFFGWLGFLFCTYLLTFPGLVEELLGWSRWSGRTPPTGGLAVAPLLYSWTPLVLSLAAWVAVGWSVRRASMQSREEAGWSFEDWLLPLTAVLGQVLAMAQLTGSKWEAASVFNLVFLAVAAMWMAQGCRHGRLRPLLLGSLLLVALVVARYFDLFESLAARGLVFLVVGGLLIAEGVLFRRARQRPQAVEVNA